MCISKKNILIQNAVKKQQQYTYFNQKYDSIRKFLHFSQQNKTIHHDLRKFELNIDETKYTHFGDFFVRLK